MLRNPIAIFALGLCSLLLGACSTVAPPTIETALPEPEYPSSGFRQVSVPPAASIFALSPEQIAWFRDYMGRPRLSQLPKHEATYEFLRSFTEEFNYRGETSNAEASLAKRSGNCLSLAVLTTALARLSGVEVGYELTDSVPVFELSGTLVKKGLHVRSILYESDWVPKENFLTLTRPGFRIDYFPSGTERFIRNLSEAQFIALYYRNLAADALAQDQLSRAYHLVLASLQHAPQDSEAVNMMGIIYRRAGDLQKSEEIFLFGIQQAKDKADLLRNYRNLLLAQDRDTEAAIIQQRLIALEDPDPFDWLLAGHKAYNDGDLTDSVRFYRQALELAPYLHEAHFGVAKSFFLQRRLKDAEFHLQQAKKHAYRAEERRLYDAKLAAIGLGE